MPRAPAIEFKPHNTDSTSTGSGGSGPPDDDSHDFGFPDPWADDRRKATLRQMVVGVLRALLMPWRYGPAVRCPSCGTRLTVQSPFEGVGYTAVHEYRCLACNYTIMVPYYEGEVHD